MKGPELAERLRQHQPELQTSTCPATPSANAARARPERTLHREAVPPRRSVPRGARHFGDASTSAGSKQVARWTGRATGRAGDRPLPYFCFWYVPMSSVWAMTWPCMAASSSAWVGSWRSGSTGVEGVELVKVAVAPDGRAGAAVARVRSSRFAVDRLGGEMATAFGERVRVRREVGDDPVHPGSFRGSRVRRIGIVHDEHETFRGRRHVVKGERRRAIGAFAGVIGRNRTAIFEDG